MAYYLVYIIPKLKAKNEKIDKYSDPAVDDMFA